MKNLKKLGKTLKKSEQKQVSGGFGFGPGSGGCSINGCFSGASADRVFSFYFEGGPCTVRVIGNLICSGVITGDECCVTRT